MARIACTLAELLTAVKRTLVDAGVFTDAQCWISLMPDEVMTMEAAPAAPLGLLNFTAMNQMDTLSCEDDESAEPTMQGVLNVSCWLRVALDHTGVDHYNVTKPDVGESDTIRNIVATLNNHEVLNGADEGLTWRTLTYQGFTNRGKWREDMNWIRLDVRFDMTYSQKVSADPSEDSGLYFDSDFFGSPYYTDPYFA